MKRTSVVAMAMILLVASSPSEAQHASPADRPGAHPGWLPPEAPRLEGGLTAAQRQTAIARLEAIKNLLLQVPELAQPNGFEVQPRLVGGYRMYGPGRTARPGNVVEYVLQLWIYYPTKKQAGEGCTCIEIRVNPTGFMGGDVIIDAEGREIYMQMERGPAVPGATQVFGELSPDYRSIVDVLFTAGGQLPWKPITREQYLRATILHTEGKDGVKMAEFRASLEKTRYQEWMEGAEQRKKERDETLTVLATMQPAAEVAKMRKTLEDQEREMTETLRKAEGDDRERNKQVKASGLLPSEKFGAMIEAMTPAERSLPALIDATQGWRFADADTDRRFSPILTPDYDFWRARTSRVEARSIQVHIAASLTGQRPPVHRALWQVYSKLDWAALARLLDTPH